VKISETQRSLLVALLAGPAVRSPALHTSFRWRTLDGQLFQRSTAYALIKRELAEYRRQIDVSASKASVSPRLSLTRKGQHIAADLVLSKLGPVAKEWLERARFMGYEGFYATSHPALRALESEGLLERKPCASLRRLSEWRITAKGEACYG